MARRSSRGLTRLATIVVALVALLVGIVIGGHPSWLPSALRSALTEQNSQAQLVTQVTDLISRDYYRKVDTTGLLNQGLAAAVSTLGDPYSHYLSPNDYQSFQTQTSPHVSGVGVDVTSAPAGLRIVDVFPGTPAAAAGLHAGDVILAVGATSLRGRSATSATGLITGQQGTKVTLTVQSGRRRQVVSLKRANVLVASGGIVTLRGVKIGDVRLTAFTDGSGAAVRAEVQKVLQQHAQVLILDLRSNGGGLLEEAVNVASVFIPDGTIVSTAGRSQARQVYTARGNAIATKIPMVVLVDRGTASAAEIVTGALQDRGRAKVVGTHTYGKGVFQEIQPLINGGALDITVGEYFTPNGHNLGGGGVRQGAGIRPDVYALDNPHTTRDEALQTAERVVVAEQR